MTQQIQIDGETYQVGDRVLLHVVRNVHTGDSRGVDGTETVTMEGEIAAIESGFGGTYVHLADGGKAPVASDYDDGSLNLAEIEHAED